MGSHAVGGQVDPRMVIAVSILNILQTLIPLVADFDENLDQIEKIYKEIHAYIERREPYDASTILREIAELVDSIRARGIEI